MSYFLSYMEKHPDLVMRLFDRPIPFQRIFVAITGKVTAALMLSWAMQLTEDGEADAEGWLSRTTEDWTNDTGLSKDEQATAKRRLLDLELFEDKRFRVDNGMRLVVQCRINFDTIDRLVIEDDIRTRARASAH